VGWSLPANQGEETQAAYREPSESSGKSVEPLLRDLCAFWMGGLKARVHGRSRPPLPRNKEFLETRNQRVKTPRPVNRRAQGNLSTHFLWYLLEDFSYENGALHANGFLKVYQLRAA